MKKVLKWIMLVVAFVIVIFTINGIYQEAKIKKGDVTQEQNNTNTETQYENINNEEQNSENNKVQVVTNLVESEYKGYKVAANLKIEKLNIDTCVLNDYTYVAMDTCVTKFFGPEPNEIGNFCIVGHNYITKNMFGYLYKLKIGDTFTLTDNEHGTVEYKIYNEYRAKPNETYRIISKNKWKKGGYINYLL